MENIRLGYARTSTKRQNLKSQEDLLRNQLEVMSHNLFTDQFTGTKDLEQREGWAKLLKRVEKEQKTGNKVTICFYSINRMSRNEEEGYNSYMNFYNEGIELEFHLEPHLNTIRFKEDLKKANIGITGVEGTDSKTDKLVKAMFKALEEFLKDQIHENIKLAFRQAEKEAEDIKHKVLQGLKNSNKKAGRPKGYKSTKQKNIPKDFKEKLSRLKVTELAQHYGVTRPTIYSWKKEVENEEN